MNTPPGISFAAHAKSTIMRQATFHFVPFRPTYVRLKITSVSLSLSVVLFFILLQPRKHDRSVFIIEELRAVINNWRIVLSCDIWYVERW